MRMYKLIYIFYNILHIFIFLSILQYIVNLLLALCWFEK